MRGDPFFKHPKPPAKGPTQETQYPERRAVPRFHWIAEVEVIELKTHAKLRARTSEVSLMGCYIDTMNPFPAGSLVKFRMIQDRGTFEAAGRVAYTQPSLGMGIVFTEISDEHRKFLESWLAELNR